MNFDERMRRESIREKLYQDIEKELDYARSQWGNEFDSKNTLNDWVAYITMYAGDAAKIKTPPSEAEQKLIKVAGLAISALENLRANGQFAPRHYEEKVAKD